MLKKLMKHEWKSIGKIPVIMLIVLFVSTIIAGLTFAYPVWESETLTGVEFLVVFVWMLYYGILMGISVGLSIYLAVHFYKSMYTDEGYLTHTLPVTPRQLLVSKWLPMTGWLYIMSIAMIFAILLFAFMAVMFIRPDGLTMMQLVSDIKEVFAELGTVFGEQGGVGFFLSILLMMVVSGFSGSMMVIGSVTLGQLVSKHKILGSVGAYFAINSIVTTVSMLAMLPMMISAAGKEIISPFDILTPTYTMMSVVMLVVIAVLFFVSELIMKKKLNLD